MVPSRNVTPYNFDALEMLSTLFFLGFLPRFLLFLVDFFLLDSVFVQLFSLSLPLFSSLLEDFWMIFWVFLLHIFTQVFCFKKDEIFFF